MEPERLWRKNFCKQTWFEWQSETWNERVKTATVTKWCAQDEVNQEESEQNEVDRTNEGADSTGKVMHIEKSGWLSFG